VPCSTILKAGLPERSLEAVERWESAHGWIDLTRCREDHRFLEIRQNVHYVPGNTAARRSEERQGHLQLLLHPDPRQVLFIGLGTSLWIWMLRTGSPNTCSTLTSAAPGTLRIRVAIFSA